AAWRWCGRQCRTTPIAPIRARTRRCSAAAPRSADAARLADAGVALDVRPHGPVSRNGDVGVGAARELVAGNHVEVVVAGTQHHGVAAVGSRVGTPRDLARAAR